MFSLVMALPVRCLSPWYRTGSIYRLSSQSKSMSSSCEAGYSATGTWTRPKAIAPFQIERGMASPPARTGAQRDRAANAAPGYGDAVSALGVIDAEAEDERRVDHRRVQPAV